MPDPFYGPKIPGGKAPWTFYTLRIIDDKFSFRSQYCLVLPRLYVEGAAYSKVNGLSTARYSQIDLGPFRVCGQIRLGDEALQDRFICLCSHVVSASTACRCWGVRQCENCGVAFQVVFNDHEKNGFVLIVTAWFRV